MKATGLHFSSEHFIDSTPPVAQFDVSASTLNSLSKSGATNTVRATGVEDSRRFLS